MISRKLLALAIGCQLAAAALFAAAEPSELKDETGKTIIKYVVEAPEGIAPANTKDPARQVGLILCFPEHDRPVGDELYPVREALQRLGIRDHYVLLAGGPQTRKFSEADHEPISKLIAWAKKTYPVNPRRVYMYGKGEGGKISGQFAMLHPEIVTSAQSYSWAWWMMPAELTEAIDAQKSAPEFYMVLGLRDLSYHLTTVRDGYSRVSFKGYKVIYREFEELGARTYHQPSNDDGLSWATKLRNKNLPLSAEEAQILKRYNKSSAAPANGYFADIALVGGAQAGAVIETLASSANADVRAAAAATAARAVFPESTMSAIAKLAADPSAKVRRAALRSLAVQANWRSEVSQQALIAIATGKTKAVDEHDRMDAADGIVNALKYQLHGARQDPDLFSALVTLLRDSNEELRTIANNTLAPVRDRAFRGDLGRPEIKEPVGGWDAWLNEVSAKAAGYRKDYAVCSSQPKEETVAAYCAGGNYLLGRDLASGSPIKPNPALAFQNTKKAAEQGYTPAQAALGMMYAVGKGVEQSYVEAANWWTKAAEAGHILAATNLSMVYRGAPGVKADPAKHAQWSKFAAEHSAGSGQ